MDEPAVEKDVFGVTVDGVQVDGYTLRNSNGLTARLISYGATLTELHVPGRNGRFDDVVLGYDNLAQYETESPYFGATVGRVAFRIAEGAFSLDGKAYQLTLNDGPHHLAGGIKGFSWVVWQAEAVSGQHGPAVRFTYHSPDGDQGYPGNLDATVVHTLTDRNELRIDYTATTDQPTPVNMTHHSYFNLAGAGSGDVLGHLVQIEADRYSVTDEATIATGELAPVEGTPWDFRESTAVGARLQNVTGGGGGYDLAYLRRHPAGPSARVATVREPSTGRAMEVLSTEPGVIFYTGNYLDGSLRGKGGTLYRKHAGFCLETGGLPDAVHHPNFPTVILRPGQTYRQTCTYRFSAT